MQLVMSGSGEDRVPCLHTCSGTVIHDGGEGGLGRKSEGNPSFPGGPICWVGNPWLTYFKLQTSTKFGHAVSDTVCVLFRPMNLANKVKYASSVEI